LCDFDCDFLLPTSGKTRFAGKNYVCQGGFFMKKRFFSIQRQNVANPVINNVNLSENDKISVK